MYILNKRLLLFMCIIILIVGCKPKASSPIASQPGVENTDNTEEPGSPEEPELPANPIVPKVYDLEAPLFPESVTSTITKNFAFIEYMLVPENLIESVKNDPSPYVTFGEWVTTTNPDVLIHFVYSNIELRLSTEAQKLRIDFADEKIPTITGWMGGDGVKLTDLSRSKGNKYPFSQWSNTHKDVERLTRAFPALTVQPGEKFTLLLYFGVYRMKDDGQTREYFFRPINLDRLGEFTYTMES